MEDYKKKYEDLVKDFECILNLNTVKESGVIFVDDVRHIIPELKDSEDERVRKELINFFKNHMDSVYEEISDNNVVIAWLEKQGEQKPTDNLKWNELTWEDINNLETIMNQVNSEFCNGISQKAFGEEVLERFRNTKEDEYVDTCEQKPTDKVEPKFKVGDWIINSEGMLRHIIDVGKTGYETDKGWLTHDCYEKSFHLWTIQDAKDGDVLCCENGWTCIFKSLNSNSFSSYCFMDCSKWFCELGGECHSLSEKLCGKIHPATKEQLDLLFSKMKENGYEWDAEKKELKKIETNPTWSEEDETKRNALIYLVEEIKNQPLKRLEDWDGYISWLKSLKERYTWKPTDEQIKALLKLEEMHVLEHKNNQENAHLYMVIKNIREQLLKLK